MPVAFYILHLELTQLTVAFIKKENAKKTPTDLLGEDVREGLLAIISVKVPDPKFSSQTKEKLVSSEVEAVVSSIFSKYFKDFLLENPKDAMSIVSKVSVSFDDECCVFVLNPFLWNPFLCFPFCC